MSQHYDVIAIGAGSGGLSVVEKAVKYGKKCAVVEVNDEVGGTCVNRGCVPKKVMWYAAELAHIQQQAIDYGFALTLKQPPFSRRPESTLYNTISSEKHKSETIILKALPRCSHP